MNAIVRPPGHGRPGRRRPTRSPPHRYRAANTTTTTVTTGANCHRPTTLARLYGGSGESPILSRLPLLQHVVAGRGFGSIGPRPRHRRGGRRHAWRDHHHGTMLPARPARHALPTRARQDSCNHPSNSKIITVLHIEIYRY